MMPCGSIVSQQTIKDENRDSVLSRLKKARKKSFTSEEHWTGFFFPLYTNEKQKNNIKKKFLDLDHEEDFCSLPFNKFLILCTLVTFPDRGKEQL